MTQTKSIRRFATATERECAYHARGGDTDARDELVMRHLQDVLPIAFEFRERGVTLSDLVQTGRIGLIEAARRYDPDRGSMGFADYARWWIRRSILENIGEEIHLIHIPRRMQKNAWRVREARRSLEQRLRYAPSMQAIAEKARLSLEEVEQVMTAEEEPVSLDTPVTDEGETLHELIPDENAEPADNRVVKDDLLQRVHDALALLTERESAVIRLHYGLGGTRAHTYAETGQRLGISRERVKKLEKNAFRRLHDHCLPETEPKTGAR
jgi:RNA polymerase primary sigma factor